MADATTIAAMADDFERRFRIQSADIFQPGGVPRIWTDLGLAYLRFSDENSNPRSLDQQLLNVLNRARRDGVFVPWQCVLADAAVRGTLTCRRGDRLAKTLVERRSESGGAWFLIDDLSRMSRNTIESLRLGERAGETGVHLIGASDGFDSANPQSSLLRPVLGSMNEAFVSQLRSKVKRGMDDAFRRGDNIHSPGVGYRLVDVEDATGNLVITHKNMIEKAVVIDRQVAKRERFKELQRAGRRPNVKSVKEKDVVAALTQLRDLLQGDVGIAAQVLKALVGDVILETRQVAGQAKPQMVARFTINAVPALAVLERGRPTNRDGNPGPVWDSIHSSPTAEPPTGAGPADAIVPLIYDRRAAARKPRKTSRKG